MDLTTGSLDLEPRDQADDRDQYQGQMLAESFRRRWNTLPRSVKNEIRRIVNEDGDHAFDHDAHAVLDFMNAKREGRRPFRPVEANMRLIRARLREGATVQEMRAVVAQKWREVTRGEFPEKYYRPATLFNAEKFAQYLGMLGA